MKLLGTLGTLTLGSLLVLSACGGTAEDATGDGDSAGDGDVSGDGDGDTYGDGDIGGDGDGDNGGDGGTFGDGDGDVGGDGDGDGVYCTTNYVYGLTAIVFGGALIPEPVLEPADGLAPPPDTTLLPPPDGDLIAPPDGTGGGSGEAPVPYFPCFAEVVATDGDYVEVLQCSAGFPSVDDCQCYGAGERAGSYTVTATWGDFSETQEVTVTGDVCHVRGVQLAFFEPALP